LSERLKARPAELRDAAAIAAIYNKGIEDRVATSETEPRTSEAIEGLLGARAGNYPAVVVEEGDRVLGFAWAPGVARREWPGRRPTRAALQCEASV
jgi:L-amino acid N-acyltransferase YncA